MTAARTRKIVTPLNGFPFVALYTTELLKIEALTAGARRLLLISLDRMDSNGHAYFGPNMARDAAKPGRSWPATDSLTRWRTELCTLGIADPGFTCAECVVIFCEFAQRGETRSSDCPWHLKSTGRSWRDGDPKLALGTAQAGHGPSILDGLPVESERMTPF